MIVAVIMENDVSINEYPYIKSVDEIRNDFTPETLLIELAEMPETKEGYQLKYNGSEFYYEEIIEPEYEPTAEEMLNAMLGVTSYE